MIPFFFPRTGQRLFIVGFKSVMERLEDLVHNADYDEEIKRLLNQGYTLEEAEEIREGEQQFVRDLYEESWLDAIQRMEEEGN